MSEITLTSGEVWDAMTTYGLLTRKTSIALGRRGVATARETISWHGHDMRWMRNNGGQVTQQGIPNATRLLTAMPYKDTLVSLEGEYTDYSVFYEASDTQTYRVHVGNEYNKQLYPADVKDMLRVLAIIAGYTTVVLRRTTIVYADIEVIIDVEFGLHPADDPFGDITSGKHKMIDNLDFNLSRDHFSDLITYVPKYDTVHYQAADGSMHILRGGET